ncbi:hypothetical protein FDB64_05335 [Clostridium botulinum]|nr:hypothetical protein [Clostridium botulinum]NFM04085.1 hypothetical protein [Clostridium botulinum]
MISAIEKGNTNNVFRYLNTDDLNTCYNYYQKFAETLINKLKPKNNLFNKKSIKQLDFSYLWEKKINAGSLEMEKTDRITINEGAIIKIYNFFYKLNTRENTINTIIPLESCKEINASITYTNHKEQNAEPIITEMILSDNKQRNNIAEYMAMFTIKFLIAHEIGHAFNGHTSYYLEVRRKIIDSKEKGENLEKLYLDLQTMEYDADVFAANRLVDEIRNLFITNDKILSIIKKEKDIFQMLKYSIHGLFYLFRDYDTQNYRIKEHPPALVRECMVLDSIMWAFKKNYMYTLDQEELINIAEIEKNIWIAEKKNDEKYNQYLKIFTNEAANYSNEINNNWKEHICCKIKPESRLPIEGIDY